MRVFVISQFAFDAQDAPCLRKGWNRSLVCIGGIWIQQVTQQQLPAAAAIGCCYMHQCDVISLKTTHKVLLRQDTLHCTADREFFGQIETGAAVQHVLRWCMKAKAASIERWQTQRCTAVFTQVK